jgi:MoaA/NifB/PqqE/SkfB family radical SAM enzyme
MLPNPKYLYLVLTKNCNYQCTTCDCWKSEKQQPLNTQVYYQMLTDFKKLSPNGIVIITGGEPTIYFDTLISILNHCKTIGLKSYVTTNGSFLNDYDKTHKFLKYADRFSLSLNSHVPKVHNDSRGVPNSFEVIEQFIKTYPKRCDVCSILGEFNILDFEEFYSYCQKYFRRFQLSLINDKFNSIESVGHNKIVNKKNFIKKINFLIDNYDSKFIINPLSQLEELKHYIEDYQSIDISYRHCQSPYYNIMVDYDGTLMFCFYPYLQVVKKRELGNIQNISLTQVYNYSNYRQSIRNKLYTTCKKWCATSNCHLPDFY